MNRANATLGALAAIGLVVAITSNSWGASAPALDFQLQLGARQPASATSMTFHTVYRNPADPSGKPSPLRKSVIQAPRGTVFDGHAVPTCSASGSQLMLAGSSACPQASQVGTGTVIVITGCGPPVDPETLDAALFNSGNGIIELFTDHSTGAPIAVGHATFTAPNTLTETPAPNPGCPPSGETSVRQVDFHFNEVRGAGGAAFITSPPSCPASRRWASKITATVADGHSYVATSSTACVPTPASPFTALPSIRIEVRPRHVRAGARVRFVIRLQARARRCLADVSIALDRTRTRSDVSGQATLVARLVRPGVYRITATKAGCRRGRASITAGGLPDW
jgi:hypothetical protein